MARLADPHKSRAREPAALFGGSYLPLSIQDETIRIATGAVTVDAPTILFGVSGRTRFEFTDRSVGGGSPPFFLDAVRVRGEEQDAAMREIIDDE